ncbi:hypothetical protein SAMN05421630_109179 [Prauserella marina]|uniref:Uncharacterized protein n=1 Tax=Prauserella marina TaxID=530584 RepID=A0A1G6VCW9_9PSEU|nr:hypothetical protein DES30_103394 [Prauserella marina]SDD51361.1 hypothetical protein SAMN05421630_109179 [Prauserella marina]
MSHDAPARNTRLLPIVGFAALLGGSALMGLLHLLPVGSDVDPVRRTISEYALGPGK